LLQAASLGALFTVFLMAGVALADSQRADRSLTPPANSAGSSTGVTDQITNTQVYLPAVQVYATPTPVPISLVPFDANTDDLYGPSSPRTHFGKEPEIIVAVNGNELDVLVQDYDADTPWTAMLLHIAPGPTGFAITQKLADLPMLDGVMGLAVDGNGNRYYATGVDESSRVSPTYPPRGYRSDIVRVVKVNAAGEVLFNVDLDAARGAAFGAAFPAARQIINPMTSATARLAVGGNELALIHGNNSQPDPAIGYNRHQLSVLTQLDARTGAVTGAPFRYVSHSFDQRLLYDGAHLLIYELGDGNPRSLALGRMRGREGDIYPASIFHIKGPIGENCTATRLGNLAFIENDSSYRYLALFATETTDVPCAFQGQESTIPIQGPRNLAIVRVRSNGTAVDTSLPDELTVTVESTPQTNRLKWLTSYSAESNLHAERPKLVSLGGNRYIVLWEEWRLEARAPGLTPRSHFNGVYAMLIDDRGNTVQAPRLLTTADHLHRGDDAFLLGARAAWMTGDAEGQALVLHFVDGSLNYQRVSVPLAIAGGASEE
jgi:hypothetical protein